MRPLRSAFTLVELILYIGLSVVVIVAMLNFTIQLTGTRGKEGSRIELQQQLRIAAARMSTSIRHAQEIDSAASVFNTASGVLALSMSGTTTRTVFSLSGGSVYVVEKVGKGRITTKDIHIEELRFTNVTASGTYGTVQFLVRGKIEDPRYTDVLELRSTVSVRQ